MNIRLALFCDIVQLVCVIALASLVGTESVPSDVVRTLYTEDGQFDSFTAMVIMQLGIGIVCLLFDEQDREPVIPLWIPFGMLLITFACGYRISTVMSIPGIASLLNLAPFVRTLRNPAAIAFYREFKDNDSDVCRWIYQAPLLRYMFYVRTVRQKPETLELVEDDDVQQRS